MEKRSFSVLQELTLDLGDRCHEFVLERTGRDTLSLKLKTGDIFFFLALGNLVFLNTTIVRGLSKYLNRQKMTKVGRRLQ